MKLDKIKFASLIGFISCRYALTVTQDDIREIDELIDIDVPVAATKVSEHSVNDLLFQIGHADGFIPAIKAYRALTGAGLKESKEAVERYRVIPKFRDSQPAKPYGDGTGETGATLGDILGKPAPKPAPFGSFSDMVD